MSWLQRIANGDPTTNDSAFCGNCGMYAIALAKRAQEQRKNVSLLLAINEPAETIDELSYSEPDIYHIAVKIDGILYDGSGKISIENLI